MICEWGMSDVLGPVTFGKEDRHIFLGREMGRAKEYSEATAVLIDEEIKELVNSAIDRARSLLTGNVDKLHLLADALLKRETLTGADVDELFGRPSVDAKTNAPKETGDIAGSGSATDDANETPTG